MPLPSPRLDDRTFEQLMAEARARIRASSPEWTDLGPGDPGVTLVEVFAHLTETMLYRLNRVPEKAYVEFLRLLGVELRPPSAATARLRFTRSGETGGDDGVVTIPAGTRVMATQAGEGGEVPVFVTARAAEIRPGEKAVEVVAFHCEQVNAEAVGTGTGAPGQVVQVSRAPIVAPTADGLELVVGVEAQEEELSERVPAVRHEGKTYRIWTEVDRFADAQDDPYVYEADRQMGVIRFAPAAYRTEGGHLAAGRATLAAVPAAGREIRAWYRRGGGPAGNLPAGSLTGLLDSLPGVEVVNPERAVGGRAIESTENALVRGPHELRAVRRAVTARDYELLATSSAGGVVRARAITLAQHWAHAAPGTVEVLVVPHVPESERGRGLTAARMREGESPDVLDKIQRELDRRRPLGTACRVRWARYKTVTVEGRVVVHREESADAVRTRLLDRLHGIISPVPTAVNPTGWRFGQVLRAFNIQEVLSSEPGVSYAEDIRMVVENAPGSGVRSLAVERPPRAAAVGAHAVLRPCFAASGGELYRTVNDGDGWERAAALEGKNLEVVAVNPYQPGLVATVARTPDDYHTSFLHVSWDSGENWMSIGRTEFRIHGLAWTVRDRAPTLLLATERGLYEHSLDPDAGPVQVEVDPTAPDGSVVAVASTIDIRGSITVAGALGDRKGVVLSLDAGKSGSFETIGLTDSPVRVLAFQHDGPRTFLWAGFAAEGDDPGDGCRRVDVTGGVPSAQAWSNPAAGWTGGTCYGIAFFEGHAVAASHRSGVARLPLGTRDAEWQEPGMDCGLPPRDKGRFEPVFATAADDGVLLVGGPSGVFRSRDGVRFHSVSGTEFRETVTLPETWLFCSGSHQLILEVAGEAE
jgi:hypothetical protein